MTGYNTAVSGTVNNNNFGSATFYKSGRQLQKNSSHKEPMPTNQNFRREGLSRCDLTQMLKDANKEDKEGSEYRKHLRT